MTSRFTGSMITKKLCQCRIIAALLFLYPVVSGVTSLQAQTGADETDTTTLRRFILHDVQIIRHQVFDSTGKDLPVAGPIMNDLHILTKEHVIRYEVFPEIGDTVEYQDLGEIEQNLRNLKIFSSIELEVIPLDSSNRDEIPPARLRVITRDAWSTSIGAFYNIGGNSLQYGLSLSEGNFLGFAQQFVVGADYSNINERGWRGSVTFTDPNLFGSHLQTLLFADYSRLAYNLLGQIGKPFYSDRSTQAFNLATQYFDGNDFDFGHGDHPQRVDVPSQLLGAAGWYSWARLENGSAFRATARIAVNTTHRDTLVPGFNRAFENSIGVYAGIGSQKRRFAQMQNIEFAGKSQIVLGASGNVVLGKIIPINGGLDNMVYIGADARQAVKYGPFYGFGSVESGTGFENKEAKLTLLHITASAALQLPISALVVRFDQTSVWNWNRYIYQPLDNINRLRGYDINGLIGANQMIANIEYRVFPPISLLFLDIGATLFYDVGAVWEQGEKLDRTRFHNSLGAGLRLTNNRVPLGKSVIRIEFAYNVDEKRIAPQLIISNTQVFDVFGTLDFRPPAPYLP